MSLNIGMRSKIKGITNDLKEASFTNNKKNTIKAISRGNSHNWSTTGNGIKSMISITRANITKTIPVGESKT